METLSSLDTVLSSLENDPCNVRLITQQCQLLKELSMSAEYIDTLLRLSSLVMLDETTWLSYFDMTTTIIDLDSFVDTLERFEQAERDYLSLPILRRHIEFIIKATAETNPDLKAFLTDDYVRGMLRAVVNRGVGLLANSHELWELWIDWEITKNNFDDIHQLYLDRLASPHLQIDDTLAAYSSFCTAHAPSDYELRLIEATKAAQTARAILGEKRYGRTREDIEQQLVYADPSTRLQLLSSYIDWEIDPKAAKAGRSNQTLTTAVFERTVAAYSSTYKASEAQVWLRYTSHAGPEVLARATRACPESAALWSRLLNSDDSAFDRAIALGMLDATGLAELFVAKASRQNWTSTDDVLPTIAKGFEAVQKVTISGDPSLRLEKFLLDWAETRAPDFLDQALVLVDKPIKSRSASYQMTLLKAGVLTRRGQFDDARQTLTTAIQRSDLDWPEAVYEALIQFENVHGDLDSSESTAKLIEREQAKLARRREKEQMAYEPVVEPVAQQVAEPPAAEPIADPEPDESHLKRDREHTTILVSGLPENTPVSRIESLFESCGRIREITNLSSAALVEFRDVDSVPEALSRDRRRVDDQEIAVSMLWRSTLFITNFPREMDDEAMRTLFSNYGPILQTRWPSRKYADTRRFCYVTMSSPAAAENARVLNGFKSDPNARFGLTVLISDPAARAKRSDDSNSTLFIGGLESKTTQQDVRSLFQKFGTIRNIKLGWDAVGHCCRGFAFLEMATETEAKACLEMHGHKYNAKRLKVEISDRNHENKKTVNPDLAADRRSRTVRLEGLPPTAQEGLLQQALEKLVPVKKLELFTKSNHAIAELENQADVGILLLRNEPFIFDGKTILITDQKRRQPAETALSFAPRAARKPARAIGKGRQPAADRTLAAVAPSSSAGQNDFRAMVAAKNEQRKGNLVAKRSAEEEIDQDVKKPRTE